MVSINYAVFCFPHRATRLMNLESVAQLLQTGDDFPPQVTARGIARVEVIVDGQVVGSADVDVIPVTISGAPASLPNDDGGNIWVDSGFRHAFADHHFVQGESQRCIVAVFRSGLEHRGRQNSSPKDQVLRHRRPDAQTVRRC